MLGLGITTMQVLLVLLKLLSVHQIDAALWYDESTNLFMVNFLKHISASRKLVQFHCEKHATLISNEKFYSGNYFQVKFFNMAKRVVPEYIWQLEGSMFVINLRCGNSTNILDKAKENTMFGKNNVWILHGNVSQIGNHHFFSKYGKTYVLNRNGTTMDVYQIYKLTIFSKRFSTELRYKWSFVHKILTPQSTIYTIKNLTNLGREPVRVSYAFIYNRSYEHLRDYRYPQEDLSSKITYILLEEICCLFNATHVPTMRLSWGVYHNVTNDFGPSTMFSDIQFGLADVAGNVAATSYPRLKFFRFLTATGNINTSELKWFFKAPPLSYIQNIWVMPFEKRLWLAISMALIIWYFTIAIVTRCECKLLRRRETNERNCWFAALDIVITTLTQRGSDITFFTTSGKLICYAFFLMVVLLYTSYTANILIFLQSTSKIIKNSEDLLNSGMALGSIDEKYNFQYFLQPNDLVKEDVRQKISRYISERGNQFWLGYSEGMQMVKNSEFAYHAVSTAGYDEIAKTYDEETKRSIQTVDSIIRLNLYLCVLKNSPLENFLKYGFVYLHEIGVVQREQRLLLPQKPSPDYSKAIFKSMDINAVQFIFLIYLTGLMLSVFILFIEIITFKFVNTKREN